MKRTKLAEDAQMFAASVDEVRSSTEVDRIMRRRLQTTRRQLIRTFIRIFQLLTDDELCRRGEALRPVAARASVERAFMAR